MSSELIKGRLLAQIKTNELIRLKIETCLLKYKKYWKDELVKSESITEGLRIAFEIANKHELKKAA